MEEVPESALEQRDDEPAELYVIFAKDVSVKSQADAINQLLDTLVSNKTRIYASEVNHKVNDEDMWTLFWNAPLTASQAEKVKADPNVGGITKSSTTYDPLLSVPVDSLLPLQKRDRGITRQRDAAEEMKFLSQPYHLGLQNFDAYVYDGSAGSGITEFKYGSNVAQRVRWLFGQGGGDFNTDEVDLSPRGHGTCMLDKVAGNMYGVTKKASPVIVRAVHPAFEAFLDTVRQIEADYLPVYNQDPKHARAIINLSWGYEDSVDALGDDEEARANWISELRGLLKGLISMGATIVVPAGNGLKGSPINQYPTLFAGQSGDDGIPELIVVGGVEVYDDKNGNLWERSRLGTPENGVTVDVYAPSYLINCANNEGGFRNRQEVTGTSLAAAQVSGMCAYFLGLSSLSDQLHDDDGRQRVLKLKRQILTTAWARNNTQVDIKAIWNTEDPGTCRPPPNKSDSSVGQPCQVSSTTATGNDLTIMGDCYITTVTPTINPNLTGEPQCSCADGAIAGVGSTEVMGTTYSWCQTGGPPVYPTGMQTVVTTPPASPPEPTPVDEPAAAAPPPEEAAEPEKPEGKCNKDDASPLNVGGGDCE
ncbi:MAG: hypothetical protein L6R38_002156 [Xanthoria sp. 2 TBL-2021]|nr:MAG: hypothetical protein L6R38_002156 [Xanthoria sp. 2 TBL-2021]